MEPQAAESHFVVMLLRQARAELARRPGTDGQDADAAIAEESLNRLLDHLLSLREDQRAAATVSTLKTMILEYLHATKHLPPGWPRG